MPPSLLHGYFFAHIINSSTVRVPPVRVSVLPKSMCRSWQTMATELEKQIAELMSGVASIDESAKKAKADGARVRRKSRELDNVFSSIDSMKPAEKLTSLMRRRRGSRDFDDAFLLEAFNELDIDGSGKLNRDELKQAIEKVDPNASMNAVTEMIDFADKNKDGQIDFEEFKKAVTTKPDMEAAGASNSAAPSK